MLQIDNALPPKRTVPHEFRFETDSRVGRRKEFDEKLQNWEKRSAGANPGGSGSGANEQSRSRKPIPDFRALHAAHEATAEVRRRELTQMTVTVPVTPHFSTQQRAIEREKFEEARRAREIEIERQLAEMRRAREEEEEREWRAARKLTIPRANAIPEWYADAPKRKAA